MSVQTKEKLKVLRNKQVKQKLAAFCRAGAAVTAGDKERSTFWRNLEQAVGELNDKELAMITGETNSPIGDGDTPLHVLIKIDM